MFDRSAFDRTPFDRPAISITVVNADTFRKVIRSVQVDFDTLRQVRRPEAYAPIWRPSVFTPTLERVAILENAIDPVILERLNGEYTLEFNLPGDDPKWEFMVEENIVQDPNTGQYFTIKEADRGRDDSGIIGRVRCEHVFFSLLDEYIEDRRAVEASATVALTTVLEDTPFSPGVVNVGTYATAYFVRLNPVAAINRILERWGGEIRMRNYTVDLLTRRGSDRGVQFRYRKNLQSVNRTVNTHGLVTRLYPYGWDGLTIESVNGGLKYIDSPHINDWPRPKIREVQFDYEVAAELKAAAEEYLTKHDTPLVSYETSVLELKELAEYGQLEEFELGDDIRVIDESLGIDIKARIVEYEQHPLDPANSRVTIANFRQSLEDELSKFKVAQQFVDRVKSGDEGYVSANWLQGVIDTLKAKLLASAEFEDAEVRENVGLLFENTNPTSPAYGGLYIGPGLFAIADSQVGGEWDWRTFGTGAGFTADELNAGRIRTDLVSVESADGKLEISGNLLRIMEGAETRVALGVWDEGKNGLLVMNGEIYSTLIRSGAPDATSYIEMGTGYVPLKVVENGKIALDIYSSIQSGYDGTGGSIQFYDVDRNELRGQITAQDDATGDGLRVMALDSSYNPKDLHLAGNIMRLDAPTIVLQDWATSDCEVIIGGRLQVNGYVIDDLHPDVDDSHHIGRDALRWARVRARYVDQGDACFSERECAICGESFENGDRIILLAHTVHPVLGTMSIPVHERCKDTPATIEWEVPEVEEIYEPNELGEPEKQLRIATQEVLEPMVKVRPGYEMDKKTGQYRKNGKKASAWDATQTVLKKVKRSKMRKITVDINGGKKR